MNNYLAREQYFVFHYYYTYFSTCNAVSDALWLMDIIQIEPCMPCVIISTVTGLLWYGQVLVLIEQEMNFQKCIIIKVNEHKRIV